MKRALLVGINYTGSDAELRGCENDVAHMKTYLESKGYNSILVVTEKTPLKPTRSTILHELLSLVTSGANEMFFHYSGHGSYVTDRNGDERDGRDECLVPLDYTSAGMILDDHIRGLISLVPPSAKLMMVLDSCHSGTCVDLAYNLWDRSGAYRMVREPDYTKTDGDVFMLSGSQDVQTSADAYEDSQFQGAMTWALLKALRATPSGSKTTWVDLIKRTRETLKQNGYDQVPNFSSGRQMVLSTPIFF